MPIFSWTPTPDWWADNAGRLAVALLGAILTSLGSVFYLRLRRLLVRLQPGYLGRVNIGITSLNDGTLRIRTLLERSLEEVFLDPDAVGKVRDAVRAAKDSNAFLLPLPPGERWYVLNFVLNAVVEQFAPGYIRQDAGQSTQRLDYLLFLTYEQDGQDRFQKVRAVLIQEEHLRNFPYPGPQQAPHLENPDHVTRVETLRQAALAYQDDKQKDLFLRVQVCLWTGPISISATGPQSGV